MDEIGLPCVVRPSFTMGGSGSPRIAYNRDEFDTLVRAGSINLPVTPSAGWKSPSSAGKSTRWR